MKTNQYIHARNTQSFATMSRHMSNLKVILQPTAYSQVLKSRNKKFSRPDRYNQLRQTVRLPKSPIHIPLSLPYRLLVILVSRGFLRDYTSIDELLVGKHVKILIKQESMEQPVMLKSSPHRTFLADSPRTVNHYTKYMKRFAMRCESWSWYHVCMEEQSVH